MMSNEFVGGSDSSAQTVEQGGGQLASMAAGTGVREYDFEFKGQAGEFFRIWIVNVMLSVLTLGIYSAWAKVRNKKYLYASTELAGAHFNYHGDPAAILKGRMIAGLFFLLWVLSSELPWLVFNAPWLAPLLLVVFALIFPWLVFRSMRFNLGVTSYRGLRFGFDGTLAEAYKVYLLYGLVLIPTLGVAYPWWQSKQKAYLVNGARFGSTRFQFLADSSPFWRIYFAAAGWSILASLVIGVLTVLCGSLDESGVLAIMVNGLGSILLMLWLAAMVFVRTTNTVFCYSRLGGHALVSNMEVWPWVKLQLVNSLAIVFSLGLLYPWAKVRALRYRAAHMAFQLDSASGSLDDFVAGEKQNSSALGEEVGDMFDLEIGI